jgi:hypothetical protein
MVYIEEHISQDIYREHEAWQVKHERAVATGRADTRTHAPVRQT